MTATIVGGVENRRKPYPPQFEIGVDHNNVII
jgi:hypothetical protein